MLPVSAWPPGPPGSSLSPFGKPRRVSLCNHPHGFVIPKGAWIVVTGSNSVRMFFPPVVTNNPPRSPGTGYLPGQIQPCPQPPLPPCPPPCPPTNVSFWQGPGVLSFTAGKPSSIQMSAAPVTPPPTPPPCPPVPCPPRTRRFRKYNDAVEAFRAWQRRTGNTDPPLRPLPGRRPPNWYGWKFVSAPGTTLVQPGSSGLVLADGQNVVLSGSGSAMLTQAFSV